MLNEKTLKRQHCHIYQDLVAGAATALRQLGSPEFHIPSVLDENMDALYVQAFESIVAKMGDRQVIGQPSSGLGSGSTSEDSFPSNG